MPFFKKEIPQTPIYLPIGRRLDFDFVDRDAGYLSTNDGYKVAEIRKMIARGVGGMSEISESEYQEFLKKKALSPSQLPPQQREQIALRHPRRNGSLAQPAARADNQSMIGKMPDGRAVTSVAAPQRSDGLQVPKEFVKPRIGKAPPVE